MSASSWVKARGDVPDMGGADKAFWPWMELLQSVGYNRKIYWKIYWKRLILFSSHRRKLFQLAGTLVLPSTRSQLPYPRLSRVCVFRLSTLHTSQTTSTRTTFCTEINVLCMVKTQLFVSSRGNCMMRFLWLKYLHKGGTINNTNMTSGILSGCGANDSKHSIKSDFFV